MRTDDLPEIVEIIDDDGGAFGDRVSHAAPADRGGPRWVGPLAGLALVALIGYGVVSSASTTAPPQASSPSSTVPPPTTRHTQPPFTERPPNPPSVPYYAADPPRPFRIESLDYNPYGIPQPDQGILYQFWAKPGSSAESGQWFSVEYLRGSQDFYAPDAYRVETPRGAMAVTHLRTGITLARVVDGLSTFYLASYGLSDDDLVRLVDGLHASTHFPETLDVDPAVVDGFDLLSETAPWASIAGSGVESVSYSTPDHTEFVYFALTKPHERSIAQADFPDRRTALRFALTRATSFTVDGRAALAGEVADSPGTSFATWMIDGRQMLVTGSVGVPELISIAQTTHTVTEQEWNGMHLQAAANQSEPDAQQTEGLVPRPVASGTDGNGMEWEIDAGMHAFGSVRQLDWQWGASGYTTPMTDQPHIDTFADSLQVHVLAQLPRAVATAAELHVQRAGMDDVVVPFNDVDPSLDRTLAAYAFSEPGTYTAQIVGAGGSVLATWPSA